MRSIGSFVLSFLAVAGSLLLAGCGCDGVQCGACSGVAVAVQVLDAATMQPIEDASVTIDGAPCPRSQFSGPGVYACDVQPGTYSVSVSAPGHAVKDVSVTLPEDESDSCCSCGPQTSAKVVLDPA
ncbi:MAG: hypothetical protein HUU21_02300 [Polyangiaceae bacterium]|nr:hypothetical protein [Polyangiaceae bacterium]NUQ72366.1 hypothetical protein [Polyangiaceae bacterium]